MNSFKSFGRPLAVPSYLTRSDAKSWPTTSPDWSYKILTSTGQNPTRKAAQKDMHGQSE